MTGALGVDTGTGPVAFGSTAWTVVADAGSADPVVSRRCLGLLIERYWRPVYAFVRQLGNAHEDAKDLTQGFFAKFLENDLVSRADRTRGRFRSYVIGALKRFLARERRALSGRPLLASLSAIDSAVHEPSFFPAATEDPERAFMRNWAKCVIENCLARLHEELKALGKEVRFRAFEARYGARPPRSYAEVASELGIAETAVRKHLEWARKRFAGLLREELRNTVLSTGDVEDEIRELAGCLG
jgi:RNA polymerase sigma-70 factor (ECF subfamily)